MKLLAHLVRADLRQFRWAILLWVMLVFAEAVLTAIRPAFVTDMRTYGYVSTILNLLWFALQIAMLLIVPLIVQAHPAVGTDAFWMTRPIPPQKVFASKVVLLAGLTVLVPCIARLGVMVWIQVPVREALLVVLDSTIARAAWLALLLAGAVVTLNLARFALLCGAVFVSLLVFMTILFMWARTEAVETLNGRSGPPVLPPSEDPTQLILFLLGAIVAGFGLAAIQYRTRLRRMSVPTGAGGLVLMAFAIPYWPFPFLKTPSALPAWADDANAIQLRAASPEIEMSPVSGWAIEGVPTLRHGRTRVIVSGLAPGWMPRLISLGGSVTLNNGATLASHSRGYQAGPEIEGSPDYPSRVVAREVLGVQRVFLSAPPGPEMAITLMLPANEIDSMMPANGRYRGYFGVYLAHWEAAATLPLRPGALFQDPHYKFAVEQVDTGPDGQIAVRAREWRATSSFDRKPPIAYAFYARNAQHTHAMAGYASEPFEGMIAPSGWLSIFGFTAGGGLAPFFVRAALVSFPLSYGLPEQKVDWDPRWYADAELVIVRTTETGAVLRTLEMPQVSLVTKR